MKQNQAAWVTSLLTDLYMNEFWEDPALDYAYMRPCKGNVSFDSTMMDNIWCVLYLMLSTCKMRVYRIPNTVFINSKSAVLHSSPFVRRIAGTFCK